MTKLTLSATRILVAGLLLVSAWSVVAANLSPEELQSLDQAGLEAYVGGDFPTALARFMRDAKTGDAGSMYFVGFMLQNGEGTPKNYQEANRWFQLAAQKGNAEAMASLGKVYSDGLGVLQDFASSFKWYQTAASHGSSTAMLSLALAYAHGRGVTQDYSTAASWFKACSEAGAPICMVSFGNYLKSGVGIDKDLVSAYAWFNLAAARRFSMSDIAASSRDEIGRQLSAEQLSQAQALSFQFAKNSRR